MAKADKSKKGLQTRIGRNAIGLTYHGTAAHTPEELVKQAKIDLNVWEVMAIVVNQWEVGGKVGMGQDKTGKWNPEQLWKMPLRQVHVSLRRKVAAPLERAIKDILADNSWPRLSPVKYIKRKGGKHHAITMDLHDAHFGKLCWAMETGDNYDLKIAETVWCEAVDRLLDKVGHLDIDRFLIPIGSDFFHVDNWIGTTSNGTPVESTDDRFSKIFKVGTRAFSYAVNRCLGIAPIDCFWLPGNHDRATSWFLTQVLMERFGGNKHVAINDSPSRRKYVEYGTNLIGFAHGDGPKLDKLPLIMAGEAKEAWARTTHRHIHTGHLHKKAKYSYNAGDTFNGVEVWVLQSLSGCDGWHHENGFVKNVRAAEAHAFSSEDGYYGHFTSSLI